MNRSKSIVKISIIGIIVNLILVATKATVGILSGSVAVVLDAVNNFTDALSSIVTILGVFLSQKRPDKKHPFGYGRIEYFSALIVSLIVLAAGVTAVKESIDKIINPGDADYSVISLVIIGATVLVKLFFGRFVLKRGKELNSSSLKASGIDAISDAALSSSVLVGALVSFIWHVSLEGYIGILISIVIIKTAIEILRDAISDIIGSGVDAELMKKVQNRIKKFDDVQGVYDLTLHNYGPNKIIASAHIQIDDEMRTGEIHNLSRKIETAIYNEFGIILTIGVYAANEDGEFKDIKDTIEEILKGYSTLKQMHGFYVDAEKKAISFDLIFSFEERGAREKIAEIKKKIHEAYPKYSISIVLDADI